MNLIVLISVLVGKFISSLSRLCVHKHFTANLLLAGKYSSLFMKEIVLKLSMWVTSLDEGVIELQHVSIHHSLLCPVQ